MGTPTPPERWHRWSTLAAVSAGLIALMVLVGWGTGRQELARAFTSSSMKFNTAVGVALLALATIAAARHGRSRWLVRALCAGPVLIGAATLAQYALGISWGIDELVVLDPGGATTSHAGRMSPVAASLLVLVGGALVSRATTRQVLLALASAAVFVASVGHLLGVAPFFGATTITTGIAPHTVLAFLLLVAAGFLARPDEGLAPLLRDDGAAGYLARRLIPLAILVPPAVAWIALQGSEASFYDEHFGSALIALANAIAIATVAILVIRAQARARRERDDALAALRRSHAELEERVRERTEELGRAAEDLRRSNRDLEEFAFLASHDLQAPLRQVSAFATRIEEDDAQRLDERSRQRLRYVIEGTKKMGNLIDGLLALSRAGRRDVKLVEADPADVVKRALDVLAPDVQASGARVTITPMPRVLADKELLVHVFQNLLANALKYRDARPLEVFVEGQVEEGHARLTVRDNGRGVDPEAQGRIFGMFQRDHVDIPGSGIGLALVKLVVERHGGRVGVASKPGEGSEFWFTLPLSSRGTAA